MLTLSYASLLGACLFSIGVYGFFVVPNIELEKNIYLSIVLLIFGDIAIIFL